MAHVEINGSYLEGGGQIVRTAVSLAAATGRSCRIHSIRAGRSNPGLRNQHTCAVRAAAEVCGARLSGNQTGSREVLFHPGELSPPETIYEDVGTAGAATLVAQTAIVPLVAAGFSGELAITGGTHVHWAPSADYFQHVFAWYLDRMGVAVQVLDCRPGYYPRGGGRLRVALSVSKLAPIRLTHTGPLSYVRARSLATPNLRDAEVAERQERAVRRIVPVDQSEEEYRPAHGTGSALLVTAGYAHARLGASALGEKGKRAEAVGVEAAGLLDRWMETGACLDEFMADQILPYMALAGGPGEVTVAAVTRHCRTNAHVIEQFLPVSFDIDEDAGVIRCRPDE